MLNRTITRRFLLALEHIQFGAITVETPDGQTYAFKANQPGAQAQLKICDWRFIGRLMQHGDIALAEGFRDGGWESEAPTQLFLFGLQNQSALDNYIFGSAFGRLAARIAYFFTRNTLHGSQKNIHAHYDLGNDFYALWLDPSMTYSAAIFNDEQETLQTAQTRKYDRIIDFINPSGQLLEIGCGWGGFTQRALQKGDDQSKALTLSKAQHAFASERVEQNANIVLEDYRHQKGRYDQIVSIEMFEAVGEKFWPVYFSKLKSLLAHQGKAMVQTITISDSFFDRYRTSGDAIRSFIFPGGMLPSALKFREESAKAGLQVTDEFAFGQDYARTLELWLKNFETNIKAVKMLGFDDPFIRLWRFYLTFCIAAFRHGRTDVVQWQLKHAN